MSRPEPAPMPSPFPGMDPYLESPSLWRDVHTRLINAISENLLATVRPKYFVRIEERVYIADAFEVDLKLGARVPDVLVTEAKRAEAPSRRDEGGGGVAVAVREEVDVEDDMAEPVVVTTSLEGEVREAYLVLTERDTRRAVTILEVVSPTNKLAGSPGLESFLRKRAEVLASAAHWVEIDLLRAGISLSARALVRRPRRFEYMAHVSPVGLRPEGKIWPIRLTQRLPVVDVPLLPGDADAKLDLQAVLNTTYDRAGYGDQLDYTAEPDPPLPPELAAWADRRLRERGVRTAG